MKTAVILFNLGGPDSKESIKPFLFNFFTDPNIIPLPYPLRWLVAKMISIRRSKREAGQSYSALGDKSPLLENTRAQAQALEEKLGPGFKVFICMRYWHPMADAVAQNVKNWGPTKIVLLPLYPQFSTTTTWSSLGVWKKACTDCGLNVSTAAVCCYPFNEGFIKASAENIRSVYARAQKDGHTAPRILFSAHGLPEDVIRKGDPYQWQCEQTAEKIIDSLGIESADWRICYQSRVGPKKWIGPSTEDEIRRAAQEKKAVIIYPHAFTQEHVETLVELDIEYRHVAEEAGIPGYYRAATVSVHPDFIAGLAALVRGSENGVHAEGGRPLCPQRFDRCCMQRDL
jgi:ferrochelatase